MNSNSEPTIPISHSLDTNDVMMGENNNLWLPKLNAKSKRGYILFSAEVRKRVMNEIPEAKFGEVLEIIGIEWKRLSNEDKRDYVSRARFIAAERAKAGLLTPNSKLPQHTITHQEKTRGPRVLFLYSFEANDLLEKNTEELNDLANNEFAVSMLNLDESENEWSEIEKLF
uniref:HMG box domain-containing protein n=1 Tax=Meloidogyne javanica TaxID=6303 RepID=A0A915LT17_MELJA